MAVRALDELLYNVKVNPGTLNSIASVMSDEAKAMWLRRFTNFPRPAIASDGIIRVPDPNGSEHLVEHIREDWGDAYTCVQHGFCWATHSARREYELQSGIEFERNTGESVYLLRPGD